MKSLLTVFLLFFTLELLVPLALTQPSLPLPSNFSFWSNTTSQALSRSKQFFSSIHTQPWFWLIIAGIIFLIVGWIVIPLFPLSIRIKFWMKISFRLLGAFLFFIGLALGEIAYAPILASLIGGGWNYQTCRSSFSGSPQDIFSCVVTGYTPRGSFDSLLVFYCLGFLVPFIYLLYFLHELLDWIESSVVRNVLTVLITITVYRVMIAKILIPVLALGIAGAVLGLIDLLTLKILGFSSRWLKMRKEKRIQIEARLNQLLEAYNYALKTGNFTEANRRKKEIDKLRNEI